MKHLDSCLCSVAKLTFEIRLGQEKTKILDNKKNVVLKVQSCGVKVQRSF